MKKANKKIRERNLVLVPDPNWLKEDYGGCTAALAGVEGSTLWYQFIGSCGVGVTGKKGNVKLQTPDEYWSTDNARWDLVMQADFIKGFAASVGKNHEWWRHSEGRFLMRRFFRNKPKQKYSFGVLTGEKEAEHYIRDGKVPLAAGDVVLVYSDGLRKPLFSAAGRRFIAKRDFSGLEEFCRTRVDSEGSVVYWTRG